MNEQQIEELLQRYFDGKTTLLEERELQRFFAEERIPDSLSVYRPMFAFFTEEQAVKPSEPKVKLKANVKMLWLSVGIAASIAILFLVGLPQTKNDEYAYYIDGERVYDQVAAVESVEAKLQMMAASMEKLRTGMSALDKVQEGASALQQIEKVQAAYQKAESIVNRNN